MKITKLKWMALAHECLIRAGETIEAADESAGPLPMDKKEWAFEQMNAFEFRLENCNTN